MNRLQQLAELSPCSKCFRTGRPTEAGIAVGKVAPALLALLTCIVGGSAGAQAGPLDIQPMTKVDAKAHSGYMSDPYPIHLAPSGSRQIQFLSGTTPNVLACAYPVTARCFMSTDTTVDASSVMPQIKAAGMQLHGVQNRDIFQADDGSWHMVVGIDFGPNKETNRTLIAHASAGVGTTPGSVPTSWSVDRVLVGSFADLDQGNYDCKYLQDGGRLYLLYVKNLQPNPLVNGIVLQPMLSPTRLAPVGPTLLLSPEDKDGGLSSETFATTRSKLVEAANIQIINGKYAMAYSTGSYLTSGYKAGVAWSDTLLPAPGHEYRKVLKADYLNVWHNPSRIDVHYLIQSQIGNWPNFTGNQVIGPGVNSFVQGPGGAWYMYFNAYKPHDMPMTSSLIEAADRRPYFVRLRVNVPTDEPVAAASNDDLARWIMPATR